MSERCFEAAVQTVNTRKLAIDFDQALVLLTLAMLSDDNGTCELTDKELKDAANENLRWLQDTQAFIERCGGLPNQSDTMDIIGPLRMKMKLGAPTLEE